MDDVPITARALGRRLGIAATWLRREAEAGRLPHFRAGRTILFDAPTIFRLLRQKAASEKEVVDAR